MKTLLTPLRLLDALSVRRRAVERVAEPLLQFDKLPPLPADVTQPLPRRFVEQALEEGSHRVYVPMAEAEVIERPRRR
ncbi:hypothetical protein ACG04Q_22350 [Roseateles sp. DXS20W]|uniref:Uncharacterized protein n=1 Tax=Pelomonas lactea TaxID=3299030 RepID=A0ABW7GR77_9BURK